MRDIGFPANVPSPRLEIEPPDMLSGTFAYYDPGKHRGDQRVVLSLCAAGEPGMAFREYGHHVALNSLGFDMVAANDLALQAIETGLVSYFACSYQNEPTLGRRQPVKPGTAQASADSAAMINLENNTKLNEADTTTDYEAMYKVGEAWGGLFWDIRKALGRDLADRILLSAWRGLPAPNAQPHQYATKMAQKILAEIRAKADRQKEPEIRSLLEQRSLKI